MFSLAPRTLPSRSVAALCLALAILSPSGVAAKKKGVTTYDGPILFGEQTTRIGGLCIALDAAMTAGTFFQGLRRIESSQGVEFREGDQPVKFFPSQLSVVVVAVPKMCDCKLLCDYLDPESRRLLNQLQFDAHWKTGLDETSVTSFTVAKPEDDLEQLPSHPAGMLLDVWKYRMAIETQDIPLETHLIVSVFDKDRNLIVRLSGAL